MNSSAPTSISMRPTELPEYLIPVGFRSCDEIPYGMDYVASGVIGSEYFWVAYGACGAAFELMILSRDPVRVDAERFCKYTVITRIRGTSAITVNDAGSAHLAMDISLERLPRGYGADLEELGRVSVNVTVAGIADFDDGMEVDCSAQVSVVVFGADDELVGSSEPEPYADTCDECIAFPNKMVSLVRSELGNSAVEELLVSLESASYHGGDACGLVVAMGHLRSTAIASLSAENDCWQYLYRYACLEGA